MHCHMMRCPPRAVQPLVTEDFPVMGNITQGGFKDAGDAEEAVRNEQASQKFLPGGRLDSFLHEQESRHHLFSQNDGIPHMPCALAAHMLPVQVQGCCVDIQRLKQFEV